VSVHKPGFSKFSVGENHGTCGVCGVEEKWWGNMKEDSIIMELREIEWNRVDWIHLAQVTDK